MRDLEKYARDYVGQPFDDIHLTFRRRRLLAQLDESPHDRIVEVSCGKRPLFLDFDRFDHLTILEPSQAFLAAAQAALADRPALTGRVTLVQAFLEDAAPALADGPAADVVVCSNVLQEVPDPAAFLAALRSLCGPGTLLHLVVPNARSFHRLLAQEMGLIPTVDTLSDRNRLLQQARVYDRDTLTAAVEQAGFTVESGGTTFVKPFTHAQIQAILYTEAVPPAVLDGLDRMVAHMPDLGAELYLNCRIAVADSARFA